MANPKPTYKYQSPYEEPVAVRSVCVRLPSDLDEYVRSLPNRTEWLREAVAEKKQRDESQESEA